MGAIDTNYTFTATDVITSTKMNNILDQSTITATAVFNNTLDVASGKLLVKASGITANELAANSVTTTAITDLNVTTGKIADLGVTTAKVADLSITPQKLSQPLTKGVVQTTTSGTNVIFTGIPSWAKRITVMFNNISTDGTSYYIVQLGDSGGAENSGYNSFFSYVGSSVLTSSDSTGVVFGGGSVSTSMSGLISICNISNNDWVISGIANEGNSSTAIISGAKTLSDVLTQIKITTINGTDFFDAGAINIMYE